MSTAVAGGGAVTELQGVPIGALPSSRRHHGSDHPARPVPATQQSRRGRRTIMTTRQRSTLSTSTDPPARGEVILGVDTHGEVHVAALVGPLGQVLGTKSFPATAVGYRRLLAWARKRGTVRRAGVEGTGTFGAGLSCYLLAQHVVVFEVNRPDRTARRLMGKSDPPTRRPPHGPCSAGAPRPAPRPATVRYRAPGSSRCPTGGPQDPRQSQDLQRQQTTGSAVSPLAVSGRELPGARSTCDLAQVEVGVGV
ncbi:transposase [Streptomyces sp. NPDC088360]|uniref:IS110 family transposase n=1 Tax=Streptomyces sp. NPDC088360 TaxID=3154515 RepID=UPI003450085A